MRLAILLGCVVFFCTASVAQVDTILWMVDNLNQIDGNDVQVIGDPVVIDTEIGPAVEFNGINDGLIVDANPLAEATEFTVEIIFKPYTGGDVEQRFLHMQQDNDNRILIELRNNDDEDWTLDTFIKSGSSSQALLDYSFVHSLDNWHHAALIYQDGTMEHYVDGEMELEGTVDYQVVTSGETSLGVRLNQVSWFKGAIHSVRVTHAVLQPEDFMEIEMVTNAADLTETYSMSQFFPNPISSTGQLKLQLERAANISVNMWSIKGEVVMPIFEGFKNAGSHVFEINRNNLSAGTYFIIINYEGNKEIQEITILE